MLDATPSEMKGEERGKKKRTASPGQDVNRVPIQDPAQAARTGQGGGRICPRLCMVRIEKMDGNSFATIDCQCCNGLRHDASRLACFVYEGLDLGWIGLGYLGSISGWFGYEREVQGSAVLGDRGRIRVASVISRTTRTSLCPPYMPDSSKA